MPAVATKTASVPHITETRPLVAIVQSSYIPWKGYFDLIAASDMFILFDDVQFTKRDWRNRNRIKTASGAQWLTIPVVSKGKYAQDIDEVLIADKGWAEKHWRSIANAYAAAPFFKRYAAPIRAAYEEAAGLDSLSAVNRLFLEQICSLLDIVPEFHNARDLNAEGRKTDRLVDLCRKAGARAYLSGPSARSYMEPEAFARAGVELHYMDYTGYPDYAQLHGDFDPYVSVLDLLFMTGPDALDHMKFA